MKLLIEAQALKALMKMPRADAMALRDKLKAFAADPNGTHPWAKAFGGGMGRIRHGDWRAVYRLDGETVTVVVLKIGNRREVYR
ncbi:MULTISPECIES: type II toxin-antitoxin system RelE family toxin [Nitrospirillum]|uniref:Plasmid stabilization system n=2 Tax=Nitrospirillum TaxID=1543705 RepID=A0A248JTV4_9PROT|nr:type II toxin-antitoxin system RelE/ParE family toxin [Nitrospirillum amazonense]ASG21901.1 plasmid stabilization system [Nitrospirillum amazonense CBAmc]MEC4592827.1 type II toxin-antitoxin system RelE/ParE family toxin [Nitrospirillum amazonense]TWB29084.1 mRNA interferase RelE/StbE [Nitrospirillum amazonense]TWB37911.1 mRNA interferase RelE/StbE [Nitrospirillum amazonense]